MTTERAIRIIAGTFIIISIVLSAVYNEVSLSKPTWIWLTLFVGANLLQSGFTRWCFMESMLIKLGVKHGGCVGKGE